MVKRRTVRYSTGVFLVGCSLIACTAIAQDKMRMGLSSVSALFVEKDNPKAKSADRKSFVDESLLKEIDQSAFIGSL
jgi:hypothetical protein